MNFFMNVFRSMTTQVRAVNEKYKEPEIEMTLFVKVCLIGLKVYLFALIGLMLYKFISMAIHGA